MPFWTTGAPIATPWFCCRSMFSSHPKTQYYHITRIKCMFNLRQTNFKKCFIVKEQNTYQVSYRIRGFWARGILGLEHILRIRNAYKNPQNHYHEDCIALSFCLCRNMSIYIRILLLCLYTRRILQPYLTLCFKTTAITNLLVIASSSHFKLERTFTLWNMYM